MALLGNHSVLHKTPGRFLNGNSAAGGGIAVMRSNFNKHGMQRGAYSSYSAKSATPDGHLSPSAWVMPKTAGGMSSRNVINGGAALAGDGNLGLPAAAALAGAGEITLGALSLVVSAVAALSGSGSLTAGVVGKLEAAASLAGSGDLAGAAGALASMVAEITGSGTVAGTPYATGSASANIKGYGDLTPEGLRDSVWNAIATSYDVAGTMGEKLNASGSAGNPWIEVIESGLTAAEILRLIAAAVQGDATGLENGSPVFKSIDGVTNRIAATYSGGTRTVTARDVT